jgi:hypothetical protein
MSTRSKGPSNPPPVIQDWQSPVISQLAEQSPSGIFTVEDLELLHHFTTSTCMTLTEEPNQRNFWRIQVPQLGFSAQYLLHGILSIAALHLAHFRPDRATAYITKAIEHNQASSVGAMPLINNMNAENCVSIYLFSAVMCIYAFAKPKQDDDILLVCNGAVPDWLFFVRGIRSVMTARVDILTSSTVAVMFQGMKEFHKTWEASKLETEPIQELETSIRRSTSDDPSRTTLLLETVGILKHTFGFIYSGPHTDELKMRAAFTWLYKVDDEYLRLLKQRDQEAFCILGFFCAVLKRVEFYWWIKGWGFYLMNQIYRELQEDYRLWLRWPIEEMGWVPSN